MALTKAERQKMWRLCTCGSGSDGVWRYDARGIALCKACDNCWPDVKKRYRPEVLNDPNYYAPDLGDED